MSPKLKSYQKLNVSKQINFNKIKMSAKQKCSKMMGFALTENGSVFNEIFLVLTGICHKCD